MAATYAPWPLFLGGWTEDEKYQARRFSDESAFRSACEASILQAPVNGENATHDGYEVAGFDCRASFQPQTCRVGESPAMTGPWEERHCKSWDKVEQFIAKCVDWPFVSVVANVTRFELERGDGYTSRTQNNFPVHIFYRRLKAAP